MNNLYEAYLKTIKGSKWKETTQKYALDYLRNLLALQQSLQKGTYHPQKEGEFIQIERGKIRPITTLKPGDRIVRHVVCDELLVPRLSKSLIYDNGSSIKKKGISFARGRLETHLHRAYMEYGTNELYGLFGDFSKFYDNIVHDIAKEQILKKFDYDPYLAWLLTTLFDNFAIDVSYLSKQEYNTCLDALFNKIEYRKIPKYLRNQKEKMMKKSVNIGDQLSQIIGSFYPSEIDSYVKTVESMKYYGRYNDDFYIISDSREELERLLQKILVIADGLKIHINQKKTKILRLDQPFRYLQVTYRLTDTGAIVRKINKKRVTSMRRKLKKLAEKIHQGELPYENAEMLFRSWMGSFYKLMSKDQRTELIHLYEDLFQKGISFYRKSGKWKMEITEKGE